MLCKKVYGTWNRYSFSIKGKIFQINGRRFLKNCKIDLGESFFSATINFRKIYMIDSRKI